MTAAEKISLARFLDLAADTMRDGYRSGEKQYQFDDDPPEALEAAAFGKGANGADSTDSLEKIAADARSCTACGLCEKRAGTASGEGSSKPLVMVISGGPLADDDEASRLLDKMLASIGLSRESNCFIANAVKCGPADNRDPLPEEAAACAGFLERQIRLLRPTFMLCAGKTACQTLLKTGEPLEKLRGSFREFSLSGSGGFSAPLLATYHPGDILRNGEFKRPAWEDLKLLRTKIAAAGEG